MDDIFKKNSDVYDQAVALVTLYGMRVLMALLTLFVGFWVVNRISNYLTNGLERRIQDPTIRLYLARILNVALKIMLLVSVAGMIGVETTSFMAVFGAAGLAVGLALQGSLANFAGGVLMLVLRPFRVGDYILAQGEEGTVTAIDIFNTTLLKTNNRRVIIPNGPLIGGTIVNVSAEPLLRVEVNVGIEYKEDFSKVRDILLATAKKDPRVVAEPPPFVGILKFGESSVDLVFRAWCNNADFWNVYYDLYFETKKVLDANNITIPFPQREVRTLAD